MALLKGRPNAISLSCTAIGAGAPLLICRHVSAAQSLWLGSLTAQRGSSINQRHFQCPITETVVLACLRLTAHQFIFLHGAEKPLWHAARFPPLRAAGRPL